MKKKTTTEDYLKMISMRVEHINEATQKILDNSGWSKRDAREVLHKQDVLFDELQKTNKKIYKLRMLIWSFVAVAFFFAGWACDKIAPILP